MTNFLLRRRKLGKTSCDNISLKSVEGIKVFRNDNRNIPNGDIVFRWGCTSNVEARNIVNTAAAIHTVSNKAGFRKVMQDQAPEGRKLCPKTWFDYRDQGVTYPCIVRPAVHHQGRKLWKCDNFRELEAAIHQAGVGYYVSEFIPKVKEYRVFIVSGRVVCVANKTPGNPDDIAWNVARGGRFDNIRWDDWPLRAVRVAVEAFNLSELDFGGVDVMEAADGSCTVLEVNAACSLTSDYRQECFAKAFDYIIRHGKYKIPLVPERGGYLKFIHPAINPAAQIG